MKIKAVITGDLVKSTKILPEFKDELLQKIKNLEKDLSKISKIKIEVYRGDSFQVLIEAPEQALLVAILIRTKLRSAENNIKCDARLSLGVGEVEYANKSIAESDGEAFRISGRGLEKLGKKRLSIYTPWGEINEELEVSTAFADNIISNWSLEQSEIIYLSLSENNPQKEIAEFIGKTPQNVSKLLSAAKEQLIKSYIERYKNIVKRKIT